MTHKRLSLNRDKLKQYCGQLDLERIPEDGNQNQSPRDQKQILLNSYRTHKYDFQLQLTKPTTQRKKANAFVGAAPDSISTVTLGSMVGSVDPNIAINQYKRARAAVSMSGEGIIAKRKEETTVPGDYTQRSFLNQQSESNHDVFSQKQKEHRLIVIKNMESPPK